MSERKEIRQPIDNPVVILAADGTDSESELGYVSKAELKDYLDIPNGIIATTSSNITGTASNVTGVVTGAHGGTGIPNTGKTITLGGNLTTSGNNPLTLTTTGETNATIPSGSVTLAKTDSPTFIGKANFNEAAFVGEVSLLGNIKVTGDASLSGTGSLTVSKPVNFTGGVTGVSFSESSISGIIPSSKGGTGAANNDANTITLGGDIVTGNNLTTGSHPLTLTTTGATNVTLPTSGILAKTDSPIFTGTTTFDGDIAIDGSQTLSGDGTLTVSKNVNFTGAVTLPSNVSIPSSSITQLIKPSQGGTGVANNDANTITLGGDITTGNNLTTGSHPLTLNTTGATNVTLPTSGILAKTDSPTFTGISTFSGDVAFQGSVTGIPIQDQLVPNTMGESVADNFFVTADGYDHPDVTPSYKTAAIAVRNARTAIINTVYDTVTLPSGEDPEKCKRDIGYIVDAIAADLGNSNNDPLFRSNLYSIQAGKAYYELDGTRRISPNEVAPSKTAFTSVASQIIGIIGSGFASYVNSLRDIINGYLDNDLNWAAAPELRYGIQRGRFIDGSNLIRANRDYIINQVLEDLAELPDHTIPDETKCRRDLNFVIDAAIADIRNLSNVNAIATGYKYYENGQLVIGIDGNPSELAKTITAFRLTRDYCMDAIQNKLPNTSNFSEVEGELNIATISAGGSQYEGSEHACASVASTAYSLFNIIIGYLQNGTNWADAPKRLVGLIEKELPGRSWRTGFASIKRALAEVAKFPGKECAVRVSSGKFYEDNPLIIPQPKTAVIGDNLRTTTICPLNHGQDLFKIDSGTYLNYMVFEDNYRGGFGILKTSTQSNPDNRELPANATALDLFPGHTIKDTPQEFKTAAAILEDTTGGSARNTLITQIQSNHSGYNAAPILNAIADDLKIFGNIRCVEISPVPVNNPTALNAIKSGLRNNVLANRTEAVKVFVDGLMDILIAIAANPSATRPEVNTGTLLLVDQEWMQIETITEDRVNVKTRGGIRGTANDRHISGAKCTQRAKAFRYAASFKPGVNIFLSPYIQNCSNISVLGRTVLLPNGELDDTKTLAGGILVDGDTVAKTSPIASMVMDAFTQIVSGGVGFHHKNNGYSQLVSVFQVFEDIGILCESGAYCSVTNSATNFGNFGLKAVGFSDTAFPFYKGRINDIENVFLGIDSTPAQIIKSTFAAEPGNKIKVTLTIELDRIRQFQVGQRITVLSHGITGSPPVESPQSIANIEDVLVTGVSQSSGTITYIINNPNNLPLPADGGGTGITRVTTGRQVTKITIQGFKSTPLPNYIVKVKIPGSGAFYTRTDGLEYIVDESTPLEGINLTTKEGTCTITLQVLWEGNFPVLTGLPVDIELRRPSTVNSSSHTFEFIGSGINYTALPENGGVTDPQTQTIEVKSGKVYCSATDQDGNFTVGPFFNVDLKSGKVTFAGSVALGVIDEIQLRNSPGVPIREFSIDAALGGGTGSTHTRVSTQKAIRTFLDNRLSNVYDKIPVLNNQAGQLVMLDTDGRISASQLPARSPFSLVSVETEALRRSLISADSVPPPANPGSIQIRPGDFVYVTGVQLIYIYRGGNPDVELEPSWALLPSSQVLGQSIIGLIPPANLANGPAGERTFVAGNGAFLPVVRSLRPVAGSPLLLGSAQSSSLLNTTTNPFVGTSGYPLNDSPVVGDIEININTVAFSEGVDSSSLGVARFSKGDFAIAPDGTVSIKDEAIDLEEIKNIPAKTVLGNNTGNIATVAALPIGEVISATPVVGVTFNVATSKYSITVNGISLGDNPVLTLVKGQTYNFVINAANHPFFIRETINPSTSYGVGLQGNGTAVTNNDTKVIWTVPLNAPDTLFYQDGADSTNSGIITFAIAFTEKGANNGVATLDVNGRIPPTQIPRSVQIVTNSDSSLTLNGTHNGSILEMDVTSTITLPNNLPQGFNVIVVQKGTGQITFTVAGGGSLRHPDNHTKTAKRYSSATLYVSTNSGNNAEYILSGSTAL